MPAGTTSTIWPSASSYVEAIQNPRLCFTDPVLREGTPALTKLGMPVVASGNFAYVFKVNLPNGKARAIRCFRQHLGDRERRYRQIDEHLDQHPLPCLAEFDYDNEGIVVAGAGYPILVMEWVHGNTLDVQVDDLIGRGQPRGVATLAEEWVRLVSDLHNHDVAHGDLQHGNVIVTDQGLRLVDLDGMYVPALAGSRAAELGHIHFQHRRRTAEYFSARLDDFSALVVYLSLRALAQAPGLWKRFHEDNLIFKKTDFESPAGSPLFRELRSLGGELRRLTEVLETSCRGSLAAVPYLGDVVDVRPSRVPSWLRGSNIRVAQVKTREVNRAPDLQVAPKPAAPDAWWKQAAASPAPVPGKVTLTWTAATGTTAGTVVGGHGPSAPTTLTKPSTDDTWIRKGLWTAVGCGLVGALFVNRWYPMLSGMLEALGITSRQHQDHNTIVLLAYVLSCLAVGLTIAFVRRDVATTSGQSAPKPQTTSTGQWTPPIPPARRPIPTPPSPPPTPSGASMIVGSKVRLIYHRASCDWTRKISVRNKVVFPTAAVARGRGYRPCRVCNP